MTFCNLSARLHEQTQKKPEQTAILEQAHNTGPKGGGLRIWEISAARARWHLAMIYQYTPIGASARVGGVHTLTGMLLKLLTEQG